MQAASSTAAAIGTVTGRGFLFKRTCFVRTTPSAPVTVIVFVRVAIVEEWSSADVAAAVGTIPPNLAPLVLGGAAFEQGAVSASALSFVYSTDARDERYLAWEADGFLDRLWLIQLWPIQAWPIQSWPI